MKRVQRVLSLAAVVLLVGMYVMTLVFAISDSPQADGLFRASLACTIIVPVFLYANLLIYRYLRGRNEEMHRFTNDLQKNPQQREDEQEENEE